MHCSSRSFIVRMECAAICGRAPLHCASRECCRLPHNQSHSPPIDVSAAGRTSVNKHFNAILIVINVLPRPQHCEYQMLRAAKFLHGLLVILSSRKRTASDRLRFPRIGQSGSPISEHGVSRGSMFRLDSSFVVKLLP